jgi:hypothetical protein
MTYPKFRVQVLVRERQWPNGARDYRLQRDLRITQVILNSPKTLGICNAPAHYQSGYSQSAWYGFTSVDIYQARARYQAAIRGR